LRRWSRHHRRQGNADKTYMLTSKRVQSTVLGAIGISLSCASQRRGIENGRRAGQQNSSTATRDGCPGAVEALGRRGTTVMKVMSASVLGGALAVPATAGEIHELLGPGSTRDIPRAQELLRSDPTLVSARDAHLQETPLHIVARFGPVEMVELLIRMKADVNATAYNGFTPLHLTKAKDIAALLIRAGADLDKRDSWGKTTLQMAAQLGLAPVVEAILESGYPCDLTSAVMLGKRELAIRLATENPAALKRRHATMNLW